MDDETTLVEVHLPPPTGRSVVKVATELPTAKANVYEVVPGLLISEDPRDEKDMDALYQVASVVIAVGGDYPRTHRVDVGKGRAFIRMEFEDGELPEERLLALARIAADLIDAGDVVAWVCGAGINRSGLGAALTLRELTGCSGTAARITVQTMRPGALKSHQYRKYLDDLRPIEE